MGSKGVAAKEMKSSKKRLCKKKYGRKTTHTSDTENVKNDLYIGTIKNRYFCK